jgi:streptogramin lyase
MDQGGRSAAKAAVILSEYSLMLRCRFRKEAMSSVPTRVVSSDWPRWPWLCRAPSQRIDEFPLASGSGPVAVGSDQNIWFAEENGNRSA